MEKNKIAIIGAGIAGLVSAKYAKENGFTPIIFEKNTTIGGVWSKEGHSWPHLESNVSKYCVQFSDHYWKDEDPTFISKDKMYAWLEEYVDKFGFRDCLKLRTKVLNISKSLEQFKIIYEQEGVVNEEVFPYVIIANGYLSNPNFTGFEKFKDVGGVEIEHTCKYRDPKSYTGKRVICVGSSHSSLQISEEVSQYAEKVYSIFRKPNVMIPKYFYSNDFKKVIPNDLISFGSREIMLLLNNAPQSEINKAINNFELALSNQNNIEALRIEKDCEEAFGVGISQGYVDLAKKGKIATIKAEIASITEKGVELTNGQVIQVDTIILGTGFKSNLSFIDESLLKEIKYDRVNDTLGLDGMNVFNSDVKGLAFIGFQYYSVFTTFELQARLALSYFLNQCKLKELTYKPIANVKVCYNNYLLRLAEQLEIEPNLEDIKKEDTELYECLMKGPLMPQHFRLNCPNTEEFKFNSEIIKKWNRMFKDETTKFID
jgi:dimethylaniline monooxygenase (N-oxide forming)